MTLDLTDDPVSLTRALVDIPSVSHEEQAIADAVETALRAVDGVEVVRHRNNVMARTNRGLSSRVILAGHLDTVPTADNVPSTFDGETIHGCGSVDMKSGDAVFLHAFATLAADPALQRDLTLICYECEEIAAEFNGLGKLSEQYPEWLHGDVAILGEPSGAVIEAGCQGSIRLKIIADGVRAHSARAWMGDNALHKLAPVLSRVAAYEPRRVEIDGMEYREGINAVRAESGVANNTIPDEAWMFVNFRFAPDRTLEEARKHLDEVLDLEEGLRVEVDDLSPAALPGLHQPAAAELVEATGGRARAKFGWTDVARFSALGIPAVNFGPGDPAYAHKKDEQCPIWMIQEVSQALRQYLTRG